MAVKLDFARITLKGNNKPENQDDLRFCRAYGIFAVADGVSDRPNSAEGSRLATKAAVHFLEKKMGRQRGMPSEWVSRAIQEANTAVRKRNTVHEGAEVYAAKLADTTLDVILVYHDSLYGAHIGDSRVYAVSRKGSVQQITTDHSVKGYLQKMLGASEELKPEDFQEYKHPLKDVKKVFMATDGIYKMLSEDELNGLLCQAKGSKEVLDDIVRLALKPEAVAKKYASERSVPLNYAQSKLGGFDDMTGILVTLEGD
jgi:protein phosphatase